MVAVPIFVPIFYISYFPISPIIIVIVALLVGIIIWSIKVYLNKNFNNFKNWKIQPVGNLEAAKKCVLDPRLLKLEGDEEMIANVDFEWYPGSPIILFEKYFFKIIYLTNKRVVLTRLPFLSYKEMRCRSIPFFEIEDVKVPKVFNMPYLRFILKTGEIYQIGPNKRLFSEKGIKEHDKLIEFFENKKYLNS